MSVLVTGGAGYIGSHTCVELLNAGFDVVVVDNFCNSYEESLRRVERITGKSIALHRVDICDAAGLAVVFEQESIDSVIHFAGLKAVGESVAEPLMYYRNNVAGTLTLLECMQQAGVSQLVFSSSATVYKESEIMPLQEGFPLGTTNPYGESKLMIERIIEDFADSKQGFNSISLRYFNPAGAHESALIGEHPQGIPNNLMPYITQVAVGKLSQLQVFGDDYDTVDGTGVRDYIHVVDLAKGHVRALEALDKIAGAEVVNLGTGQGCSVLQMVQAFEQETGISIPFRVVERRAGDIGCFYAATDYAGELLGWKAEKTLADMMRDAWRWQKQNPNGFA